MRALFLFNHDAGHQVAHLAGIAATMARRHRDIETVVAFATADIRHRLDTLISEEDAAQIRWEELTLGRLQGLFAKPLDRILPASRLMRLRSHVDLFASCDMIISTERTCLRLRKYIDEANMPLFAKVPHGAGDRSVAYHPDYTRFDRSFVAGPKVVDQLVAHGVARERLVIVGYPKFEGIDLSAKPAIFDNGRPTFVYNPHFDPNLSSWYDHGPELLRWFASEQGQAFNLVFAPHVMLFRKELHVSPEYKIARKRPDVPGEALEAANILVDLDSPRLFDMSYTLGADAYIGDVSSQIYEFLARPRPAFFIDARQQRLAEDDEWHLFWEAGPVVRSASELAALLPEFQSIGEQHAARQKDIFSYTIDLGDRPASERAADAIAQAIKQRADR